ncbi:hypothetical protein ABZX90_36540 [Streptomyces sp. NPDC002935]|uniref:hypothetical protein n=1 Tax=Streptomyces sp. NPDC002935 TaxID=3154545 RepID=UPI0033A8422E
MKLVTSQLDAHRQVLAHEGAGGAGENTEESKGCSFRNTIHAEQLGGLPATLGRTFALFPGTNVARDPIIDRVASGTSSARADLLPYERCKQSPTGSHPVGDCLYELWP